MIRVLIVHNADFDEGGERSASALDGYLARAEVKDVAGAIAAILCKVGRLVRVAPVKRVSDIVEAVRQFSAHVVFNLCESLTSDPRYESSVAVVLERLGVAFTGASSHTLRLALDKYACSEVLRHAGVPTPWSALVRSLDDLPTVLSFPLIVKPNGEDGSTGIEGSSVVHTRDELLARLAVVRGPSILQRYVEGRELNAALLGSAPMEVLPLGEIDFSEMPAGSPRIVSYAAKWDPESAEWRGTRAIEASLSPQLRARVERIAADTARALQLRSYARVDVRVDDRGLPWVIDVNPNCDLAPSAGLALAAQRANMDYESLVLSIIHEALGRAGVLTRLSSHAGRAPRRATILREARQETQT